jgi:hypothetical protein
VILDDCLCSDLAGLRLGLHTGTVNAPGGCAPGGAPPSLG